MSPSDYTREIEQYLCRKNDGHLIRIVGPAFEQVSGWAVHGVPLMVAFRGIDRYFERYYRKGPRRRPVRIEFCEADVLDAFDEWRRAVGVGAVAAAGTNAGAAEAGEVASSSRRPPGLTSHLGRVIARLTARRAGGGGSPSLDEALEAAAREIDLLRAGATGARGEARRWILERLAGIDAELMAAARRDCPLETLEGLRREAAAQLAPFRERMPEDAWRQAQEAALTRLLREQADLPVVTLD
jgi:hypothetical protein